MGQPREDAVTLIGRVEGLSIASVLAVRATWDSVGPSVRGLGTDGTELPLDRVGEIVIRIPGVMRGYHRQPCRDVQIV